MEKEVFFQHLYNELLNNKQLYPYYKLTHGSTSRQKFRQAYFLQRLAFIDQFIDKNKKPTLWDCGCGFGSTCLYLSLNGVKSRGTTIEFYIDQIENRKQYWKQYGDVEQFEYAYENLFDNVPAPETYDYIILQDTLHHIEPLQQALAIFYQSLKKGGKLILIEENGSSIIKTLLLYLKRGKKRIITYHDEILNKDILMGNENIRSEKKWKAEFDKAGFVPDTSATQYLRFLPPFCYKNRDIAAVINREQHFWSKCAWIKKWGFFGLNMVFTKK